MRLVRIALAASGLMLAHIALADATEDFNALLDDAWEWQLRENPMMASQIGDRRFNDQWSDNSLAAIKLSL